MTLSYLALGDSYTIGEGVDERERWPVQLARTVRDHGTDLGDPRIIARTGWTTAELLEAIGQSDVSGEWDLVTLLAGVNDQYRGMGLQQYRSAFATLFDRYRVPVVLEHHDHTFKRTKPLLDGMANDDGVLYLGDGSWGRLRAPQSPQRLSHLAVASRDYHLSLHRIQGQERFHLALDENGRVMDVGHSAQRKRGVVQVPASDGEVR